MAFDQVKQKRGQNWPILKKPKPAFTLLDNNFSDLKQNIFQCQGLAKARARAGMLCHLPITAFGRCDTVCSI